MRKCNILVPIGCRSDEPISKPIIKRLKENELFDVQVRHWNKIAGKFQQPYLDMNTITTLYSSLDLVLICGDRIEMTAAACYAFHNHIPIAHYMGGVLNSPLTTLDDINRHCISLWSDIQFVESKRAMLNIEMLFKAIKKESNFHVVGSTYLEDMEIDESLVPKYEYDLVLINPTTLIKEVQKINIERPTFFIGANPDKALTQTWFEPVFPRMTKISTPIYHDNLQRPQFLGLLKNCKRFITNSSSAYYEAPYFLTKDQIILIGKRNKNRTTDYFNSAYINLIKSASGLIVNYLEKWWKEKNEP